MEKEEYRTCPFDKSHRILKSRLQQHIVICKVNHSDEKLVRCSYNATHFIEPTDILSHLEECKDRYKLDSFLYRSEDLNIDKYPIKCTSIVDEVDEAWDNLSCPTYDPTKYCASNLVLRSVNCVSQTERKKFRTEECRRFEKLKSEQVDYPSPQKDTTGSRLPREKPLCLSERYDPQLIIRKMREFVLREKNMDGVPATNEKEFILNGNKENNVLTTKEKNQEESVPLLKMEIFGKGRGRRFFQNGV